MKSNYDMIIWIFIFLLIALIIGLYISEKKRIPPSLYMRTGGSSTPYIEHFEQKNNSISVIDGYKNSQMKNDVVDGYKNSSSFDITGGASSKYGWGINDSNHYERIILEEEKKKEERCVQKKDDPMCTKDYIEKNKESCNNCDILQHPDIDKYVLKSSVPSCPKIDLNDYIKKSEIPVCPNLNDYIKKSEVPAQKECPTIDKCPTCPTIPENIKAKKELQNTYQFNILDVKNLKNEDIQLLLKDERIKHYLDAKYEEKNNVPKPNKNSTSESLFESNIPQESNINYNSSSSLWDEIKGLFGWKNEGKQVEQEENKQIQEEEVKKNNSIFYKKKIFEEEENKMIYNKDCKNNTFLKPMESNATGLYAGDNLYASF